MILFKPGHASMILSGHKTQTRRLGKRRWGVGAIHQCKIGGFFGEPFARVRILDVHQEWLRDITMDDAVAEGYTGPGTYFYAFTDINRLASDANPLVWVVEFSLVEMEVAP